MTAKFDEGRVGEKEEGKRRKDRAAGPRPVTKRGSSVGERSGERAPSPLHFCQEQVLVLTKFPYCTSLQLFIAPALSFRSSQETHLKTHILILSSFVIGTDHQGLPHTKAWAVTYEGLSCPQMPPPLPTVKPEVNLFETLKTVPIKRGLRK